MISECGKHADFFKLLLWFFFFSLCKDGFPALAADLRPDGRPVPGAAGLRSGAERCGAGPGPLEGFLPAIPLIKRVWTGWERGRFN